VFLVAFAAQYGLYYRILHRALRSRDPELMRPALKRWARTAVVWQVLVLVASGLYMVVMGSRHGSGWAWIAPAVGAVFGTAVPLQLVVGSTLRAARGGGKP
jgi:hypothetical protein